MNEQLMQGIDDPSLLAIEMQRIANLSREEIAIKLYFQELKIINLENSVQELFNHLNIGDLNARR